MPEFKVYIDGTSLKSPHLNVCLCRWPDGKFSTHLRNLQDGKRITGWDCGYEDIALGNGHYYSRFHEAVSDWIIRARDYCVEELRDEWQSNYSDL